MSARVSVPRIEALLEKVVSEDPSAHAVAEGDCYAWLLAHRSFVSLHLEGAANSLANWPFAQAVLAGLKAERMAHAFLGGYHAALRELAPTVRDAVALCATEESGTNPKSMRCTATQVSPDEWVIEGTKRFIPTIDLNGSAIVICSEQLADDRRLHAVRVRCDDPQLEIQPHGGVAFVPEVTHAKITLRGVRVKRSDLLPGDGYTHYLKPFRTIEDIHLYGAVAGYLLAVARRYQWLAVHTQRLLSAISGLAALAEGNYLSPAKHLALDGIFEQFAANIAGFEGCWATVDPAVTERWNRDRGLMLIAHYARTLRTEAALRKLAMPPSRKSVPPMAM